MYAFHLPSLLEVNGHAFICPSKLPKYYIPTVTTPRGNIDNF